MVERHIFQFIKDSLKDFPVVLINGARQIGKSTLAWELKEKGIVDNYVTLDDLGMLESAQNDPDSFIKQFHGSLVIDEVQRAPDLLRAIKKNVDEDRRPGRFLLTGSANVLSYPGVTESLAGRMDIIKMEGLSFSEINLVKKTPSFIDDLFEFNDLALLAKKWNKTLLKKHTMGKSNLLDCIFYGGYPEVILKKKLRFRDRWFSAYQAAYIERDVRNLSHLLDIVSFAKLYRLLGLNTGKLVNFTELGMEAKLDQRTVSRYLEMLELTFQLNILNPWFSNDRKKYIKTPKIYVNDSGQACYLSGISDPKHLAMHPALGSLFETWVWAEIRKLLSMSTGISSYFYRTSLGHEVDFVLNKGTKFWGIECKWSESVDKEDFKGLINMLEAMEGKGEAYGLILYTGKNIAFFSKNLIAVPIYLLGLG